MIKNILPLIVLLSVSACSSVTQPVSTNNLSNISVDNVQNKDISFSFKVKGLATRADKIKSVDAYLVTSATDMTNIPSGRYKYSADVVNGEVKMTFANPPTGGPYYVAIQIFDDLIVNSTSRKNITKINKNITSTDKQFSVSTNSVAVSGGVLSYSTGSVLDLTVNIVPFNEMPVTITPQDGNQLKSEDIAIETMGEAK